MKIYVACLAAYNSGILHGHWIEASSDVDELQEAVDKVLQSSPAPDAEEYAIHDYNDFPNLGEYPGLERIAEVAELIETSDLDASVVKAIISEADDVDHAQKIIDDGYGVRDGFDDFANELADEMLACHDCGNGNWIKDYFDYDKYARTIEHDYTVIDVPQGVFISGYR